MQSENAVDINYQEALSLHQQQQFDAAEQKYQEYLQVKSDRAEALEAFYQQIVQAHLK